MDFVYWLIQRLAAPGIQVTALVGILIFFGLIFGLSADPLNTLTGISLWVGLMYHLYKREY